MRQGKKSTSLFYIPVSVTLTQQKNHKAFVTAEKYSVHFGRVIFEQEAQKASW